MAYQFNRKAPTHYTGGLSSVLTAGANRGQLFYVNGTNWGNGSNANDGLRPDSPFLTLTYALAQCNDEEFDTIVVTDYWTPTGEVWPITVDKRNVSIVGAPGGTFNRWACVHPAGDTAAFLITAGGVRLVDLYIDAGASNAGISFSGAPERVGIFGCLFATGTRGMTGIAGSPSFGVEVGNCHFAQPLTAGGIYFNNPAVSRIHDCTFDRVQGLAIDILQAGHMQILDNRIGVDSDVQGRAITLGANCARCLVDGNTANFGSTAMAANPYLDSGGATDNDWLLNYRNITATLPA